MPLAPIIDHLSNTEPLVPADWIEQANRGRVPPSVPVNVQTPGGVYQVADVVRVAHAAELTAFAPIAKRTGGVWCGRRKPLGLHETLDGRHVLQSLISRVHRVFFFITLVVRFLGEGGKVEQPAVRPRLEVWCYGLLVALKVAGQVPHI